MSLEDEYGLQGYVRCSACRNEYKCHLGAWGGPAMLGRESRCSNCGERAAVWEAEEWGPPQHTPPTHPTVGSHVTNVLEFPEGGRSGA